MPVSFLFYRTFDRNLKNLDAQQLKIVYLILEALNVYFNHNFNIEKAREIHPSFFYKQLRKPYFEAGVEGKLRIVLEKDGEIIYAIFAGNHDQIRRFLAQN